ncbi:MAG: TIGR02270 family protein [Litoreibacter sp.]
MEHIPVIVDMHAEDAAMLWVQRDRAVEAPHFNRKFMARLDERLEANLDGLRVAGRAGWDAARAAYDAFPEPGEVFTLATLAFGANSQRGMSEVFEIIDQDDDGAKIRAAISGLGWLEPALLRGLIQPLLEDPRASVRALGVGACAAHRVDPGPQLERFLMDVPVVRNTGLKLAGLLGRADVGALMRSEDVNIGRYRAAWTMVRLGDRGDALSTLWRMAARPGPSQLSAFELAVIATDPEDINARLHETGSMSEELAVRAAGRIGRGDTVNWLIDRMHDPKLSRLAGESFSMITGADLAFLDLETDAPDDEGPNDDPADPVVDISLDEELPTPNPVAVAEWWNDRAHLFTGSCRYILGQEISTETYRTAFNTGFQRQRKTAALALGCYAPDLPLQSWKMRQKRLSDDRHAIGYWEAISLD